jgi:hypothetical protein
MSNLGVNSQVVKNNKINIVINNHNEKENVAKIFPMKNMNKEKAKD